MKSFLFLAFTILAPLALQAETPTGLPSHVGTTTEFRQMLLATKWSWKNVTAGVPDRECVFMADDTFRHPHFVAKFAIKDLHVVELTKKGGKAVLTFDAKYQNFEAIDFNHQRITGHRQ